MYGCCLASVNGQKFLSCLNDKVLLAWWLQLDLLGSSQRGSCWTIHSFLLLCEALSVHGRNLNYGEAEAQPAALHLQLNLRSAS